MLTWNTGALFSFIMQNERKKWCSLGWSWLTAHDIHVHVTDTMSWMTKVNNWTSLYLLLQFSIPFFFYIFPFTFHTEEDRTYVRLIHIHIAAESWAAGVTSTTKWVMNVWVSLWSRTKLPRAALQKNINTYAYSIFYITHIYNLFFTWNLSLALIFAFYVIIFRMAFGSCP